MEHDEQMTEDRLSNQTGDTGSTRDTRPEHALERVLDVIARNPKDTANPGEPVQVTQVTGNPAPTTSPALPSARPWGLNPPLQAAASGTELLTSILHFKWTILVIFILVSAPIIALVWTQTSPQYKARAEIRVRPIIPRLVFKTDENGMIPLYESFVNTQVSLIRSLTVVQRVLDQKDVQECQWYKNPPISLVQRLSHEITPPVERLRDSLSVQPRPRTEIIDVSFTDPSAKDARLIVNAVLEQYVKYTGERSDDTESKLYRELTAQYATLGNEIQTLEDTHAKTCKQLGTEAPQELVSAKRVRLDETQARLGQLQSTISILEWEVKQTAAPAEGNDVSAMPVDEKRPKYFEDAEWRKLDLDLRTLQHRIANGVYTPNHPERIRLEKDVKFAEELRRQRETQLDEQWRDRQKNMVPAPGTTTAANTDGFGYAGGAMPVQYQLVRAKQEQQLLRTELEKQQAEFQRVFEAAQRLETEASTLQHKHELYNAVRERLDQKNIERNVPGSIEVSTQAYSPSRPERDRRVVFTAMALCAGLGLGGGVAFLRSTRNQAIYTARDMPQPMQAPFLGLVPLIHVKQPLGRSLYDEMEQGRCVLTEAIRVLRTALLSRLDGRGHATILVTSANEGTGKSSFTTMLGKSIAQAGKKVLIIDADLHKMTLSNRFELLDKPGFIESLRSKAVEELPVSATKTPGLDIMPAGKRGSGDIVFEDIANGAFKACIGRLFEQCGYDIILLDSPPVLAVADAAILTGQVDGTIMVEREHISRRTDVADALIRLSSAGGRLLGTVFVGSSEHHRYGYSSNYSHYYAKSNES
jgi:capsular exopolysaccharide synthesis family protein